MELGGPCAGFHYSANMGAGEDNAESKLGRLYDGSSHGAVTILLAGHKD